MKLVATLMVALGRAADEGVCLTGKEIFTSLGAKDPASQFRVSGKLESLVSGGFVREAENGRGERVYYPRRSEGDLIREGVLSEGVHINIAAPDGEGGVAAARVDKDKVSRGRWEKLMKGGW